MKPKTKKTLGVLAFCVAVVVAAVLIMGRPGAEMEKLADEICACQDDACRMKVIEKIVALENEYAGKERSRTEVKQWDEAIGRIQGCLPASIPSQGE